MALKGIPQTKKHRENIGKTNKIIISRYYQTEKGKNQAKSHSIKMRGKKYSVEVNKKKGSPMELNPAWKGGISKIKGYASLMAKKRKALKIGASGSHTIIEWETLKAQYNWTCPCCKKSEPEIKLTEDHIIPLIKGGSNNIENIQPLCLSCNCRKHTKIIKYVID